MIIVPHKSQISIKTYAWVTGFIVYILVNAFTKINASMLSYNTKFSMYIFLVIFFEIKIYKRFNALINKSFIYIDLSFSCSDYILKM